MGHLDASADTESVRINAEPGHHRRDLNWSY